MEEEKKVPELEEVGVEAEEFNHDEHMDKVQAGLKQILASEDINEIKSIAQSLLEEEKVEAEVEGDKKTPENVEEVSMEEYLGGK